MAYEQIQQSLAREQEKRRMIQRQMLKGSAYNPNAQVSGRSIPYSPIQGLTELGKAWLQKKAMDNSDARTTALKAEETAGREGAYGQFTDQYYGREEQGLDQANMQEEIKADPIKAAMFAMQDPYLRDTGLGKAMMPAKNRGSRSRPIATNEGFYEQNPDGTWSVMSGEKGPLMSVYADPTIQGRVAGSRQQAKSDVDLSMKPQITSANEIAKIAGADTGKAMIDLPTAEVKAAETLTLIDELLDHPGFKDAVGFWDNPLALGGMMPATEAAGFKSRLKQLEGRTFMEIFPTLKGGGQITEIEGEKGQLSINRMAQATNEKEFIAAANDFKKEVERLRGIIRAKAGKEDAVPTTTDKNKRQSLLDKY